MERTWEPLANLTDCTELLNDFIFSKAKQFIGAKKDDGSSPSYLMKWKDGWPDSIVSSLEAKTKWPKLLLDFLESKLCFMVLQQVPRENQRANRRRSVSLAVENQDASGNPVEISCKFSVEINV